MNLSDIATPSLVLDQVRLEANVARMRESLEAHDVPLRPHFKTAKSINVLRLALEGQPGGVAVSTLDEAALALGGGVTDILYAVGIAPAKLAEVAHLRARGAELTVILDSAATARAVGDRLEGLGSDCAVLIEVDSDGSRAGLPPASAELMQVAHILAEHPRIRFRGLMTFAGSSYGCSGVEEIAEVAERERRAVVDSAAMLESAGIPCPVRSVGSTPTASCVRNLAGVTEVRAGVYMFQDLTMVDLGLCTAADIALSVVVSVIGYNSPKRQVITDGGWTALSADLGPTARAQSPSYGAVCDLDGRLLEGLRVVALSQEHGMIGGSDDGAWATALPVGTRLRILPNHACATAAMHGLYHVAASDGGIVARWPRLLGRSQQRELQDGNAAVTA